MIHLLTLPLWEGYCKWFGKMCVCVCVCLEKKRQCLSDPQAEQTGRRMGTDSQLNDRPL